MAGRARPTTSSTSTQLGDLPEAEVACILQHIPLKERLARCALVCSSWAAAAAAASADVHLQIGYDAERAKQLKDWLGKHGGVVTQLTAVGLQDSTWLQLPVSKLTQLQRLHLIGVKTRPLGHGVTTRSSGRWKGGSALTGPSSSSAASSAGSAAAADVVALPQLRELRLDECGCTVQLINQLLSATTLTSVQWHCVQLYKANLAVRRPHQHALSMLQQLPQLSKLKLAGYLEAADINPISTLRHLQHLAVCSSRAFGGAVAAAVAAAPAGLTALDLEISTDVYSRKYIGFPDKETEAQLSKLSQLLSYRGAGIGIPSGALRVLTGLQELRVVEPWDSSVTSQRSCSADKLLATLQHLTQLRHLELVNCDLNTFQPQPQQQPQQQQQQQQQQEDASSYQCFSALTASTQLTALVFVEKCSVPVPKPAFMHMFPAGRVLPHLKVLHLESIDVPGLYCMGPGEVSRIGTSCPALQQLTLLHVCDQPFLSNSRCLVQLPPGLTRIVGIDWTRPR